MQGWAAGVWEAQHHLLSPCLGPASKRPGCPDLLHDAEGGWQARIVRKPGRLETLLGVTGNQGCNTSPSVQGCAHTRDGRWYQCLARGGALLYSMLDRSLFLGA